LAEKYVTFGSDHQKLVGNPAVTDNKTANINDKNCILSIVLTAMDQKLQQS